MEAAKAEGNKAFSAGDFETAIKHFSEAVALAPENHVLYSNRSAAYASLKKYEDAERDAEKCISINPKFAKGYGRLGAAYMGLGKNEEAEKEYQKGLDIDSTNAGLQKGLSDAKAAQTKAEEGGLAGISNLFAGPDIWGKLQANPMTRGYLQDPAYVEKVRQLQANPGTLNQYLSGAGPDGDQRIMQTMLVLMGISGDMSGMGGEAGAGAGAPEPAQPEPMATTPEKKKEPEPEPEPEPMETEEEANKKEAQAQKALGTKHYKKKEFDIAITHYSKAWELDSTDITFLTNLSAVYFEMGDFDKCLETCQKAIDTGRELRSPFALIAKAFSRIGSCYLKKDDIDQAIDAFKKSLTENRTADTLDKLRAAEKEKEQRQKLAMLNPEEAERLRELGNEHFKGNRYAESVKAYSESLKCAPNDARIYSNRAAAYHKLMALPEALKDCNEAIRIDPTFVKAYIRKANAEFVMKKYSTCNATLEDATLQDKEGKHTSEIQKLMRQSSMAAQAQNQDEDVQQRAQNDPEVQAIMRDPAMNAILQQMQSDPSAIQEHLKNPEIKKKMQVLIDAGVVKMGSR